jgi:hypothetical protein
MRVTIESRVERCDHGSVDAVPVHQADHFFRGIEPQLPERVVAEAGVNVDDHAFLRSRIR